MKKQWLGLMLVGTMVMANAHAWLVWAPGGATNSGENCVFSCNGSDTSTAVSINEFVGVLGCIIIAEGECGAGNYRTSYLGPVRSSTDSKGVLEAVKKGKKVDFPAQPSPAILAYSDGCCTFECTTPTAGPGGGTGDTVDATSAPNCVQQATDYCGPRNFRIVFEPGVKAPHSDTATKPDSKE